MTALHQIKGIGKTSRELLEAAGILSVQTLAKTGIDELTQELERANRILGIAKRPPRRVEIQKWISSARASLGMDELPAPQSQPAANGATKPEEVGHAESPPLTLVNYEATEQVRELLITAPLAIPLPAKHLIDSGLLVSDIPPAILLNRYAGDLEVRATDRKGPRGIPRTPNLTRTRPTVGNYVQITDNAPQRLQIDTTKLRAIGDADGRGERVPASLSVPADGTDAPRDERVALIRAPLESTNRGRDPRSRRYIRGVLHTHPYTMWIGAAVTLLTFALMVPAIVAAALLLLSDQYPERFGWVPGWALLLPCGLLVVGLFYLMFGVRCSCRICNQRLFFPRGCRKHLKAHRLFGLGYIVPVALHMLLFRWFRCTYCGTPVRLKK